VPGFTAVAMAAEHGVQGYAKVREAGGGIDGGGEVLLGVEMPADGLAILAGHDGERRVERALDEVVVGDGVVAVDLEVNDVDDERVAGHGGLDVEGPGLGIASTDAPDAVLIRASGVDGGGVDGVAGRDRQDGRIQGRVLAVKRPLG